MGCRRAQRVRFAAGAVACVCAVALALAAPATKPATRPAAKPATKPAAKPAPKPAKPKKPKGPMPLVEVDDELTGFLSQARDLAKKGEHGRAIDILQALITRPGGQFVPVGGGRYVGLSVAASEIIGAMDAEGLKQYRMFYDARAEELYKEGAGAHKPALLRRVVQHYRHTSSGPKALNMLGAIDFDAGRFVQARQRWREALALKPPDIPEPLLLVKIATAHHFAGEAAQADAVAKTLKERFVDTMVTLGGRPRSAVAFLEGILKTPAARTAGAAVSKEWPGLGGLADGAAVSPSPDVVLTPAWRLGAPAPRTGKGVALLADWPQIAFPTQTGQAMWRRGHVYVRYPGDSKKKKGWPVGASVHPVVVDGQVVYRADDRIIACDIVTGERLWESRLRLRRAVPTFSGRQYYRSSGGSQTVRCDGGLYMLTAGGGKVFARYGFLPMSMSTYNPWGGRPPTANAKAPDNSRLAAINASRQGRMGALAWMIGGGDGDDEILRNGKFVSPPTYHEGSLYVLVYGVGRFHMVRLDADSGGLIWKTPLCQLPPGLSDMRGVSSLGASPPAVADGKVFALPNVGVVAAMDSETGAVLWAHHYASRLNTSSGGGNWRYNMPAVKSVNPILVRRGRLICLPADSEQLIALSCDRGEPAWSNGVSRRGQFDLSYIDGERVLLSNPGLFVISAVDGRELAAVRSATSVLGRPVVTATEVIAPAQGSLLRMDLKTYKLTTKPVADDGAGLGNLVSVGEDTLIAANAAGMCVYFGLDFARKGVDERMAEGTPLQRARLLLWRGQLAFNADVYDEALTDILAGGKLVEALGDEELASNVRTWSYRAYFALGASAAEPEKMRAMLLEARELASGAYDRAHVTLLLARCENLAGNAEAAFEYARELADGYGSKQLVNVALGPRSNWAFWVDIGRPKRTGEQMCEEIIAKVIARHGRQAYGQYDQEAAAALTKAREAGDYEAAHAVSRRWPNSALAGEAVIAAAEICYLRALKATGDEADELFGRAVEYLTEVATGKDATLHPAANVGLAAIYARAGNGLALRLMLQRAGGGDVKVKFADIEGTLGEVTKKLLGAGADGS